MLMFTFFASDARVLERSLVQPGPLCLTPVPLAGAVFPVDETNAHHHPRFIRRIFRLRE
jgi:hypothetical protein